MRYNQPIRIQYFIPGDRECEGRASLALLNSGYERKVGDSHVNIMNTHNTLLQSHQYRVLRYHRQLQDWFLTEVFVGSEELNLVIMTTPHPHSIHQQVTLPGANKQVFTRTETQSLAS